MQAKLDRWENGLGLRIPAEIARDLGFEEGQIVELTAKKPKLEIGPTTEARRYTARSTPMYTLEELVAAMKPEDEPELVDWGPDRGAEIIDDAYSRGEITLDDILKGHSAGRR